MTSLPRELRGQYGRLVRFGTVVVIVVVALSIVQAFRGDQDVVAGAVDPAQELADFCSSQPVRPVRCDDGSAAREDESVVLARTYLTPSGRLGLVIRQLASSVAFLSFALLAAVVAASEWSSRTITVRRQMTRSSVSAVGLSVVAMVSVVVALMVTTWGVLLAFGGGGGSSAPSVLPLVGAAAAMVLVQTFGIAVGTLVGSVVRNVLGSVVALIVLFLVATVQLVSRSVLNPLWAVAAVMGFQSTNRLTVDHTWPVGVDRSTAASFGAWLLVAYTVSTTGILLALWRRRRVLV